jgi:predicted membrane protein
MQENMTMARKWPLAFWLCVTLALAGFIFWLSLFRVAGLGGFRINDKVGHFLAYAALGFSLCSVAARVRARLPRLYVILAGICIGMLYGIGLEFAQVLFTSERECSVFDMLADLLGSAAGSGVWAGALFAQTGIRMRA